MGSTIQPNPGFPTQRFTTETAARPASADAKHASIRATTGRSTPHLADGFDARPQSKRDVNLSGETSTPVFQPSKVLPTLTPPPPTTYTVKEGDTGSSIAAQLGVSLQALRDANPQITHWNGIVAGRDVLNVPPPPPPPLAHAPEDSPDLDGSQSMVDQAAANQETYGTDTDLATTYDGDCLEFVADTTLQANGELDPILSQGNAAGALYEAQRQERLYADFSQMPAGAVVMWEATGNNENQGHVAIFTGRYDENNDPILITTTGFGEDPDNPTVSGVQEMTLSRLNGLEDVDAAGWMLPRDE